MRARPKTDGGTVKKRPSERGQGRWDACQLASRLFAQSRLTSETLRHVARVGVLFAASCVNNTQLTQPVLKLGPKSRPCLLECHGAGSSGSSVDLRDAEGQAAAGIYYGNQMSRASARDWRMG